MKKIQFTYLLILFLSICFTNCKKIDTTYLQPRENLAKFNGNIYEYLKAQPSGSYDSLLMLLDKVPHLIDTLKTQELTFFALTNRSFELALNDVNFNLGLPQGTVNFQNMGVDIIDTFLCRYAIIGKYLSTDLLRATDGYTLPSVQYGYNMNLQHAYTNASGYVNGGPRAIIFSDTRTSPFVSFWVRTSAISVDIITNNGVIDVISPGHSFGFGDEFILSVYRDYYGL
jgi:hypothetical protein